MGIQGQKPLLVLDVDETLIHSPDGVLEREPDFWVRDHAIYQRPGLRPFLEAVSDSYQLAVWSSASLSYVEGILSTAAEGLDFRFVWGEERCTLRRNIDFDQLHWIKDVKKLHRRGVDKRRVLMVDDSPEKLARNYGNAIYVEPFLGSLNDCEFPRLALYLQQIVDTPDFRGLEKRGWRTRPILGSEPAPEI